MLCIVGRLIEKKRTQFLCAIKIGRNPFKEVQIF